MADLRSLAPISVGRRRAITAGLLLGMSLGALEATVVGTAMPTVIATLGGLAHYSWVFSAYLLTSTASVPIWGRLSDLYGRRRMYLLGIAIFLVGSMLSGAATSMMPLIVGARPPGPGRRRDHPAQHDDRRRAVHARRARPGRRRCSAASGASRRSPARSSAATSPTRSRGAGCSTSTCRSACSPRRSSRWRIRRARADGAVRVDWLGRRPSVHRHQRAPDRARRRDGRRTPPGSLAGVVLLGAFVVVERRVPPSRSCRSTCSQTRSSRARTSWCSWSASRMFGAIAFIPLFVQGVHAAARRRRRARC